MRHIFVIGTTNAGKTTLLGEAAKLPEVGVVEVGKMMRAKYPPDYFKGQSNPAHTAVEAWQMMIDKLTENMQAGKRVSFIDGQPRDIKQLNDVLAMCHRDPLKYNFRFLHLYAPIEIRTQRAQERDAGDPAKLELNRQRLQNDNISTYEIVTRLQLLCPEAIRTVDTSESGYNYAQLVRQYVGEKPTTLL